MGHIFRLKRAGAVATKTTIVDWSNSTATTYNHGYVDGISDATTTQNEITSIPSPFARIELASEEHWHRASAPETAAIMRNSFFTFMILQQKKRARQSGERRLTRKRS